MGLFKSAEEKQEQRDAKLQKLLDKYGAGDIEDEKTRDMITRLSTGLAGAGMMEVGNFMAPNEKTFWQLQNMYLSTIMEQNFVIIRQLDKIEKALEK